MGKGDKKTRRGKIILGSSGVLRPKSSKSKVSVKVETAPVEAVEKVKKVVEKPKVDSKPKVKAAEPVTVTEKEITTVPEKAAKKVVKKPKAEKEAE